MSTALLSRKCTVCEKPLVAMGTSRKNGRYKGSDWQARPMHIKCLKLHQLVSQHITSNDDFNHWMDQAEINQREATMRLLNESLDILTNKDPETTQTLRGSDKAVCSSHRADANCTSK